MFGLRERSPLYSIAQYTYDPACSASGSLWNVDHAGIEPQKTAEPHQCATTIIALVEYSCKCDYYILISNAHAGAIMPRMLKWWPRTASLAQQLYQQKRMLSLMIIATYGY